MFQKKSSSVELFLRGAPGMGALHEVLDEDLMGKKHGIIEMPDRSSMKSFGPVTVPEGQFFMLDDNRDNSADSRYIGFVKRELITGRVRRILFSLDDQNYRLPRLDRLAFVL